MESPVRGVGLNLRLSDIEDVIETRPDVAFWEVIAENLFDDPAALARCEVLRADYPLSLHCVGMNLAGVDDLDSSYLAAVARLVQRLAPFSISDHLCWQRHGGVHHHDLLPFPRNAASTRRVVQRVDAAQEQLGHRLALENLSSYVEYRSSTIAEVDMLNEIASSTGCGLLLDLNNIEINQTNLGVSADDYLDAIDRRHVVELHVAGGEKIEDLVIDTHGAAPTEFQRDMLSRPSWAELPVCYERDRNLGPLAERVSVVADLERCRWGLAS